ncbi:MAG: hypothetical protein JST43_03930 [Bacteroidetes bacterium]|nr:hypothetical protein [Bacteroidota bacterium]MBS1541095.1 hypothetical protein [Bacteroidota bacterium]
MKKYFFILTFVAVAVSVQAQYYYDRSKNPDRTIRKTTNSNEGRDFDHYFFLSWDANKPLSNANFISSASSFGMKLGFRKRLNDVDRLWAGADFSYSIYKQYIPYQTYTSGNQSTSTDLYNYTYSYSVTANIDYLFFSQDKIVIPYAGLAVGVAANKFSQYYNIYGTTNTGWGVQLRPEAGLLVGFTKNSPWRLKAGVHYDYASSKSTTFGYNNFLNMGFQVGIVKMAW